MSRAGLLVAWALVAGCGGGQVSITALDPDHGPSSGGTLVTLTGINLGAVESVRIGGVPMAELTVIDGTTVTGTTAGGPAGAQDVVVTTARGSIALPGGFTYVAPPPTVTAVSPDVGPLTGGTPVTITGTGFTEVESVTIGGQSVSGLSVTGDTSLTAISPTGVAGGQDVVVVTSHGFGAFAGGFHYADSPRQFGTAANDQGAGIAIDSSGNAWVAGATQGAFPTFTNRGNDDIAIVKYGAGGAQAISQRGTVFADRAEAVAVDGNGSVYAVGLSYVSTAFVLSIPSNGTSQVFKEFGTAADDHAYALALDRATYPNVYVVGETKGAFYGFTNGGGADLFVIKYAYSLWTATWTQQYGTAGDDRATGVAYDTSTGNIYVAGTTTGAFPGYTNAGGSDVFVMKLNPDGAILWTRQFGTAGDDTAEGVATDPNGNAHIVGSTTGAFPGSMLAGSSDLFVARLDPTGAQQWLRQLGTEDVDRPGGIAVDSGGNAYVTGWTRGAFQGFTSAGEEDIVLAKLNTNGVPQWIRQLGSAGSDEGHGIALDSAGTIHVTGRAGGDLPGCVGSGQSDMFIARFSSSGMRL